VNGSTSCCTVAVLAYAMVHILSERLDATNNASFRDSPRRIMRYRSYDDLKAAQALLIEKERLERELKVAPRFS